MTYDTHTYENGFKLVYQKSYSSVPVTVLYTFVRFGSIHETEDRGIAHFIEHMCFKGTVKMPKSREITEVYDKIGAFINAYTSQEYTCYTVKCSDEYTANCIDVLADMVLHSQIKHKGYLLEKNVVKEEMIRASDNPRQEVLKMTDSLVYENTPYENPVDDLTYHADRSFPYESLVRMYKEFYRPENMGISVISNLSFKTVKKMVEGSGLIKRSKTKCRTSYSPIFMPTSCDTKIRIKQKKGVNATYLNVAFRTCKYGEPDMYCLHLIENILGGYMSSRMFSILREENGITYESSCSLTSYKDFGDISLYAVCDHRKVLVNRENPGLLALIVELLNDLVSHGITEKELKESKGNMKGRTVRDMENTTKIAEYNGLECIIYENDGLVPYDKIYKKCYEGITRADINRVIRTYFKKDNMSVVLYGEHVPSVSLVKKYFSRFTHG
jgi:predicted Zn-dependent peptidase